MRTVSITKNYETRAIKSYDDEIGTLIDGFNAMLSEIQHRTLELEKEISQHKRTQEELLKAKQVAEDASRAKSAFLANMSHELRTRSTPSSDTARSWRRSRKSADRRNSPGSPENSGRRQAPAGAYR